MPESLPTIAATGDDAIGAPRGGDDSVLGLCDWLSGEKATLEDAAETPEYESLDHMTEVVVAEMITTASEHRRGFRWLVPLDQPCSGVTELDRHGYADGCNS